MDGVCGGGGGEHTIKKFLISIPVFNKFQADCSSGSVKFMPLATMLQRKQNHPLGVTVNILLSSIFLLFYPQLKKKKKKVSHTLQKETVYDPAVSQGHQSNRRARKAASERQRGEEGKQEYDARSQDKSGRKSHKSGTQPTAICPDKDTNSSSELRELFYH